MELTLKLIREKGYLAISYDDLSKPLGVTKASIHYHFEKKEDLGLAVTDRMIHHLTQFSESLSSFPLEERLMRFVKDRASRFGGHEICPISSLQSDFESLPEMLQDKVREVSELELSILSTIISELKQQDLLDKSEDVEALAIAILALSKGLLQYQRVLGRGFPHSMQKISHLLA